MATMTVELREDQLRRMQELADLRGDDVNDLIARALAEYIAAHQRRPDRAELAQSFMGILSDEEGEQMEREIYARRGLDGIAGSITEEQAAIMRARIAESRRRWR